MSTEAEFARWLRRPEKTFLDNFRFALKAWQSADFTLSNKYEVVLSWLVESGSKLTATQNITDFPAAEFNELLQLRAQPGLIEQQTKQRFVELLLALCDVEALQATQEARFLPELLQRLVEFELLQDLYRTDYELHARVSSKLLQQYELYLRQFDEKKALLIATHESTFFANVINTLRDSVKRTGDSVQYDRYYCKHTVQPLAQVITVLRAHELCFFDEFLQLERLLTEQYTELELVQRVLAMPLHIRLLSVECAIVNRRGLETFLKCLLQHTFDKLKEVQKEKCEPDIALALTATAYTLEMLRKHDANLNFALKEQEDKTALAYVGEQLLPLVRQCKQTHLYEVLLLICAALRLNPLILEQDIFQVTTWMIVAPKQKPAEQQLFDVYLVLLMDMFRRLSRAEKLVFNLLRSLKEWLSKYKLPTELLGKVKLKRKSLTVVPTPTKKTKLANGEANDAATEQRVADFYLQIIFKDFHKPLDFGGIKVNEIINSDNSFPQLRDAWPSGSAGIAFSRLITGLVSRPSLVIWKSLIYSMKEVLASLEQQHEAEQSTAENLLFLLDLHAALLCQYFKGCRLAEQCDKFHKEIAEQRRLTNELLGTFGHYILAQEHNKRTMLAFLECCYHAANFELLLAYYLPDGLSAASVGTEALENNLHSYLTAEEWAALQQRVFNFGKINCNLLFNRLLLQRTQAQFLLQQTSTVPAVSVRKTLHTTAADINEQQLEQLLLHVPSTQWFIRQLERDEKGLLLQQLLNKPQILSTLAKQLDLEAIELLAITVYKQLCQLFVAAGKCFHLAALSAEVDALGANITTDVNAVEKRMHRFVEIVEAHTQKTHKLKQLPDEQQLRSMLQLLRLLPIGYLRRQSKNLLFTLQLAFYSDLSAAGAETLATEAFDILTDLLHFGQHVPIFKYFPTNCILKLLPIASCWAFYELVFASIKNEERGTEQFLSALTAILEATQMESGKLTDDYRRLMLRAIEALAAFSGAGAKRMRKQLEGFLNVYHRHIMAHFKPTDSTDGKSTKDKKFVEKTLAGFAPYANNLLTKTANANETETADAPKVDEHFRRVCKIYIGHSMDYRNPHAIRLLQVALNQRLLLHLDQDEIEFVLSHYWQQLNADLKSQSSTHEKPKTIETVVKMIIGNKTNEDLLLTLQSLGEIANAEKNFVNVLSCLELIAKCNFSTIKGAIFNEKFKQITSNIILLLMMDERQQFVNNEVVLKLLAAQQSVVENKMIPISLDTLDDILTFLMDINIKKFQLTDSNTKSFHSLHMAMCKLCTALIKQRHILLMDRVPQFMQIFKDLVQSIVWYKSERQKDTALSTTELDDLAELAIKLEALSHIIATHSLHVKRVAPFVLTFVINLMVANKRTTTLYPKIKTHIESICYDLIGICDHRVGRFILRCSNEAARQVYELLMKDHKKYHKFKGKI